jgi:DNA-binding transcriptional regulator YhcF (GntR family)
MRFWISKNTELTVREQLVRQVMLGILSEDLAAGQKLPSVRAVARRHRLHPNTVSAAYHELLEQGWVELRRGSGVYVRPINPLNKAEGDLDSLLTAFLQNAHQRGYEPEEVLYRLEHMVRPLVYTQLWIVEPDQAMFEILRLELGEHLRLPIKRLVMLDGAELSDLNRSVVLALPTRATKFRHRLPPGVPCIALRLRSVRGSLEGQVKPGPNAVVSIVSRSLEIRQWARAMLIAVGIDPDCLSEIDAATDDWQRRLTTGAFVVTDVVSARQLPPGCQAKVFRVVADSSVAELRQYCSR